MLLDSAIERLYDLNGGTTPVEEGSPHEKPHKPQQRPRPMQKPPIGDGPRLIAPGPDHRWHVSRLIGPRRSNGEKELLELAGKSVLLPKDDAFHPDADGLEWRINKMSA